jgi:hypothetical protein
MNKAGNFAVLTTVHQCATRNKGGILRLAYLELRKLHCTSWLQAAFASAAAAAAAGVTTPVGAPKPDAWVAVVDKQSGLTYYWNQDSGKQQQQQWWWQQQQVVLYHTAAGNWSALLHN